MRISREKLLNESKATGFRPEVLEKVIQLLNLLERFNSHPFLKGRWALKGGTALNLFLFDMPRLSVDIDLNYMFRVPLWPIVLRDTNVGNSYAKQIPVLDLHELASGKLVALFARHASRDLFDTHHLLKQANLDRHKLRLGFVLYGAMNRKDWRTVAVQDVGYNSREIENQLVPVVRGEFYDAHKPGDWIERMFAECRQALDIVLPLNTEEEKFLDLILDHGQIEPRFLTNDMEMMDRIRSHPLLQWKAVNVRQHKGM